MEENDFDSVKRAGEEAMREVGRAFASIDFSGVANSIGKAVEDLGQAISSIGKDTSSPYVISDPDAAGRAGGTIAGGILLDVAVALPLAVAGLALLLVSPIAAFVLLVIAGMVAYVGSRRISSGRHERFFADALCRIDRALGAREAIPVRELAGKVRLPEAQLLGVLDEAMERGFIPEGRIVRDGKVKMLYLSAAALHEAEGRKPPYANKEGMPSSMDARPDAPSGDADLPDEARRVLASATESVSRIRAAAAKIQDAEVRSTLEGICATTERISAYLMHHPETALQFRHAATYYLPTTAKLAASYAELEEHGTGAQVEKTLKDLRTSFAEMESALSKLSDELVLDQSMDVLSDIEVLRTMLRQDGLSDT